VIGLITEWMDESGRREVRGNGADMGGTMRLGGQKCQLEVNTLAHHLYQQNVISERHRHRYEFNNHYLSVFAESGMMFSGKSTDGQLVEMIEIPSHPWFLACQFHPEFTSTPRGFIQSLPQHRVEDILFFRGLLKQLPSIKRQRSHQNEVMWF